jgi:hypothetical protein
MRANRHPLAVAACVALLIAAISGACGDATATPSDNGPTATAAAAPTETPAVPSEPAPTSTPAETDTPTETPVASSEDPTSSPSDAPGSAAACSGSDNNRDFFADAAENLAFDVYCPVLPRGWFVDTGEYSLRNGGMLAITYHGPGGAVIDLLESGPCQEGDDCMPAGTEEGDAAFGNRPATLVALDDGRLTVVAEATQEGQWSITGTGLDEAALTKIAADLVLVGD